MRRLFKKFVILAIVVAVIYVPLFSVKLQRPGEIVVVEDIESGRVTAVYSKKISFIPQGSLFWLYRLNTISQSRTMSFHASIPVPPLQNLRSDSYSVKIPLRLNYSIKVDTLFDINYLSEFGEKLDGYLLKYTVELFSKELERYFRPAYQPVALETKLDEIIASVFQHAKEEFFDRGIEIVSIKKAGNAFAPDLIQYAEGMKNLAELRALEHQNTMAVMKLKNDVALAKISDEEYYKKLTKISRILKTNPDVIKYIYIDKILGNVKLIIPGDLNGILRSLGRDNYTSPDGEIDNLK